MNLFETIEEMNNVSEYATILFHNELRDLYEGELIVLPSTPEGNTEKARLYEEEEIGKYGAIEENFTFNDKHYIALLINND